MSISTLHKGHDDDDDDDDDDDNNNNNNNNIHVSVTLQSNHNRERTEIRNATVLFTISVSNSLQCVGSQET